MTVSRGLDLKTPAGWQRKAHSLQFRKLAGGQVVRFIALDDEPITDGSAVTTVDRLEAGFRASSNDVLSRAQVVWRGHDARRLEWVGTTRAGESVEGVLMLVPTGKHVVSIMWYAPTDQFVQAGAEVEGILRVITLP